MSRALTRGKTIFYAPLHSKFNENYNVSRLWTLRNFSSLIAEINFIRYLIIIIQI